MGASPFKAAVPAPPPSCRPACLRLPNPCTSPPLACSIFSQTVFLTLEEWAAHKLGLLHPAEAATLQAADTAWAGVRPGEARVAVRWPPGYLHAAMPAPLRSR